MFNKKLSGGAEEN